MLSVLWNKNQKEHLRKQVREVYRLLYEASSLWQIPEGEIGGVHKVREAFKGNDRGKEIGRSYIRGTYTGLAD